MITMKKLAECTELGWYLHLDIEHQKGAHSIFSDKPPYGGWFYEKCADCWRNHSGCADVTFFDDDLFVGPISLVQDT